MSDTERTTLLKTQTTHTSKRPCCKVVLGAILLGVAVVFIFACLHIAHVTSSTGHNSAASPALQHIFSHSFRAKLKLSKQFQEEAEDPDISIDVDWNLDTHTVTYQETQTSNSDSPLNDKKTITRFIYANNSAVFGVIYGKEEQWFCQNDAASVEWLIVIHIILQKQALSYTGRRVGDRSCPGNELYATAAGQTIVFCIQGSRLVYVDHAGTRAMVTEWNVRSSDVITIPPKLEKCGFVYPNISHLEKAMASTDNLDTKTGPSLLQGKPKKHCLFIHGAGEHPPTDSYKDMSALPSYWGHLERYTPRCLTRRFMWYNSINRGWDDTESHQMFCEFAIGNSSLPISNSIIFTHSMGNLVVAAAFHRRICKFDHRTSIWYAIQAPWRGSKVSDELQSLCSKHDLGTKLTYIVLRELHYCDLHSNRPSQAYVSMNTSYVSPTGVSYRHLIQTARHYISGAVCGTSSFGIDLSFSMSARLHLVSAYTQLPLPNDGLVAFDSCNIKGNFDIKPTSKYYKGQFNHAEGTCRFGESQFCTKPEQHPCKWYSK